MPLFSVVIPVYNRAGLIGQALESVFTQTNQDFEVIVVDDGSSDDTWRELQAWQPHITALRQANAGPGAARNLGIAHAGGEYVAFLDSDDLWFPHTLANYQRAIEQYNRPAVVGGSVVMFSGQLPPAAGDYQASDYADLFSYAGDPTEKMVTSCACVRRDYLLLSGGFLTHHFIYDEYHLWMKLGADPGFVLIESPPSVGQRAHEVRISHSRYKALYGARHLMRQERSRVYPGGRSRLRQRRRLLATWVRNTANAFAVRGYALSAIDLYLRSFSWQLADRQGQFLLRLPFTAVKGLLRRLAGRTLDQRRSA